MKYLRNMRLAESFCVVLFIFKAEYSLTYIYIKIGAFYCQGIKRSISPVVMLGKISCLHEMKNGQISF